MPSRSPPPGTPTTSNVPLDTNGNPAPPDPNHGGYALVNGLWVAWVGTVPDNPGATSVTHQGQWRLEGPKSKAESMCETWTSTIFEKSDATTAKDVLAHKELLEQHIIKHGMWDVFQLQLPIGSRTRDVNLLKQHALVSMDQVKAYCKDLKTNGDHWDKQNLQWSGTLIQNSVSSIVLRSMMNHCELSDPGPVKFMAFIKATINESSAAMDKLKLKFSNTMLKDYPGENVQRCAAEVKIMAQRLQDNQMLDPELIAKIPRIFEDSKDHRLAAWVSPESKKADDCRKVWFLLGKDDSAVPDSDKFDWMTFLSDVTEKYNELTDQERYGPAVASPEEKSADVDLPQSYFCSTAPPKQDISLAQALAALTSRLDGIESKVTANGSTSTSGRGPDGILRNRNGDPVKCFNKDCGENHYARDCPKPREGDNSGGTATRPAISWRKQNKPEDAGPETMHSMERNGRTYWYCIHCSNGNGMWTGHCSREHRHGANRPSAPRASLARTDDVDPMPSQGAFLSWAEL